jgi:hypothetical protein
MSEDGMTPVWNGSGHVDPTRYRMSPDEKASIRQLADCPADSGDPIFQPRGMTHFLKADLQPRTPRGLKCAG